MEERIRKLREESMGTKPFICIERGLLVTNAYEKHAGMYSISVLRALVFKELMEKKSICINEGELIVGERGPSPQGTPTYPELCCHTIEDLEMVHRRKKIPFLVNDETLKIQREKIIPFWRGKSIRDIIFNAMDRQWKDCYEAGIFTEFMEQRAPGHTVADGKIYRYGLIDLLKRVEEAQKNLDFLQDEEAFQKNEEYKAMLICGEAMITFAKRHGSLAGEMAKKEKDPIRKEELETISHICYQVPAHAPTTFYGALQSYWFIHLAVISELNTWDSFCPGRLDQHLYPFYKKEIQEGTLTRETAKELLQCFWIKFNNQPAPPKVGVTLEESGTYTDFSNINIGGLTPEGHDGVNELSYLLLDIIDEMRLTQPSTNIQVSLKSPDHFISKALEVIRKGFGQPSVFNADAVITELLLQGKDLKDARCGGISGCVETGAFGKEAYILTGYFNLVKVLEITLNNGMDPRTKKRLGLKTGDPSSFNCFQDLLDSFEKQMKHFLDIKVKGNNIIEKIYSIHMPSPFLSIIIHDCIEKGKDYNGGGARYNTSYIQGVGIGSLADSLTAIQYHVFDGRTVTMEQLLAALRDDFAKDEMNLRGILLNKTPKYGNDDDYADDIMVKAFQMFLNLVDGRKNMKGGTYRINMLPTTCHVYFGSVIGATADGRKAKQPLSEGISPVQGADKYGPTAILKSASKMDQLKTGGTLLNQKFTPDLLKHREGLKNLTYLIRSYFRLNGHHIQFNVIKKETLEKAQQEPEKYKSLIVRVAGYSDYFNHLSKDLQDEIISRTEHASF